MERTIIIGDVHGCLVELKELISMIGPKDSDRIIFAGDIVDKGPFSAEVVKYCRTMTESRPAGMTELIEGNHENKHARFRRHQRLFREQGKPIPMKKTEELHTITEALSAEDVAYLDTAKLYIKLPEHNALVVHAGVPPSISFLPPLRDIDTMDRKKADKYKQLLRVRFVDSDGWMVPLGDETPKDVYWAEVYDGRFGHCYFGHQPFHPAATPREFPHATGLDLGCCFGGNLCAVVLEDGRTEFKTVSAKAKYAKGLWDE